MVLEEVGEFVCKVDWRLDSLVDVELEVTGLVGS